MWNWTVSFLTPNTSPVLWKIQEKIRFVSNGISFYWTHWHHKTPPSITHMSTCFLLLVFRGASNVYLWFSFSIHPSICFSHLCQFFLSCYLSSSLVWNALSSLLFSNIFSSQHNYAFTISLFHVLVYSLKQYIQTWLVSHLLALLLIHLILFLP